jgi:ArsR family transcriptional regulator
MMDASTDVNRRFRMVKRTAVIEVLEDVVCCPSVLAAPLGAEEAADMAKGFSALGEPARLRILSMLAAAPEGEVCVCDFVGPVGKSQPTISHHLKILGEAGLVHGDRRGKWVWYSLDREHLSRLRAALDAYPGTQGIEPS